MKTIIAGKSLENIWNKFLIEQNGPLLQSYNWGEFQQNFGRKTFPLLLTDTKINYGKDQSLASESVNLALALAIKHKLPGEKNYLFIPYGPVISHNLKKRKREQVLGEIIEKLIEIAKNENSIFLHLEPSGKLDLENFGFIKTENQIEPKDTFIININSSDEEILRKMKAKTRYNIRLSMRKGVKVKRSREMADLDEFYEIIRQTEINQKIKLHPKEYYKTLLRTFSGEGMIDLLLARHQGKVVAGILIVYFGDKAYYLHGGSNPGMKNLMAPHLLQWQGILYAKDHGAKYYDFCGVAPKERLEHPWTGITKFKKGFNPKEKIIHFPGAFDLPIKNFEYKMYRMAKKVKSFF